MPKRLHRKRVIQRATQTRIRQTRGRLRRSTHIRFCTFLFQRTSKICQTDSVVESSRMLHRLLWQVAAISACNFRCASLLPTSRAIRRQLFTAAPHPSCTNQLSPSRHGRDISVNSSRSSPPRPIVSECPCRILRQPAAALLRTIQVRPATRRIVVAPVEERGCPPCWHRQPLMRHPGS